MEAWPEKPFAGVKVRVPSGLTTTLPWVGSFTAALVTLRIPPSGSESLRSTPVVTGVLWAGELVSSRAVGGSCTGVTVIVTVAGSDASPPLSVTKKVMPVLPLKSAAGLNSTPSACSGVNVCPESTWVVPSASSKVPPEGMEVMVTLTTLPSLSEPCNGTGSVASSSPVMLPVSATGATLPVAGVVLLRGMMVNRVA